MFNLGDGGIAAAQPDDFWRCVTVQGQICKIFVKRDHDEAVVMGILPDRWIAGCAKIQQACLREIGKYIRQPPDKFVAQVMIKQQLHAA